MDIQVRDRFRLSEAQYTKIQAKIADKVPPHPSQRTNWNTSGCATP